MLDACFRGHDTLLSYAGGLCGGTADRFQELVRPANLRWVFSLNQIVGVSTEDNSFSDQTTGGKEQRCRNTGGVFYNKEIIRDFSKEGVGQDATWGGCHDPFVLRKGLPVRPFSSAKHFANFLGAA